MLGVQREPPQKGPDLYFFCQRVGAWPCLQNGASSEVPQVGTGDFFFLGHPFENLGLKGLILSVQHSPSLQVPDPTAVTPLLSLC